MVLKGAILSTTMQKPEIAKNQNPEKMKKIVLSTDDKKGKEPTWVQFPKYAPTGI